ncbi:MAG: O-antigen ligase family protein [Lentisphaeria bacterium]|nr:O-antigen ligase family protein [Lentisphaeria bacterium]
MKKPIRTPDPASVPAGKTPSVPADMPQVGMLWRLLELFTCLLTVLLPIKFASFVSAPEGGALYWGDPLSLVFIAWPLPVFMMATPVLLLLILLAALFRKDIAQCPPLLKYGRLWIVLGGVSVLGLVNASCKGYAPQMIAHTMSLSCYALSLTILLSVRRDFAKMLTGSLVLGGMLSICSGMYQYWYGFEALREHIQARTAAGGREIADGMAVRIGEGRVQADFNSCNVYGAYLAALLPFLTVLFWRFGNERVSPPKLSRRLFGGLAFALTLFLLVKTDSRGAVFSLLAAGAAVFFFSHLPRKWKMAGAGLLFLGIIGLVLMVAFGRGALSMYVRFDYVQAAARMMLKHPLTGTGWGDFLHDYSILRLWRDKEAAHSPHNMVMLFGSQCGVAGFLAALAVLAYPVFAACRQIRRTNWRDFKDVFALVPAFSCLVLSAGTLLDIGFETTAYSGVLIAFSLLVLMRDAPRTESSAVPRPSQRAVAALVFLFGVVSFWVSYHHFEAERAFSALTAELSPEYSFEHQDDPGYIPPLDRVQHLLREAVKAAPDSPFPWNAAADYMFATGETKKAMTCINQVIDLDPLQSAHYVKRARMNYWIAGMNVTDAVKKDLATARRLAPKNPELNRPDADICRAAFTPKEP